MIRTYVVKLKPTTAQSAAFLDVLTRCSTYYNKCCAERSERYEKSEKVSCFDMQKISKNWKSECDKEGILYSQIIQDICKRNSLAYSQFIDRRKNGQPAGLPKEKAKPSKSFCFKQSGYSLVYDGNLILKIKFYKTSKVGSVKLLNKLSLPKTAKVKTLTIIRKADGYYACITCDVSLVANVFSTRKHSAGIDLNMFDLVVLNNGETFKCEALREHEKKLDSLNRAKKNKKKKNGAANCSPSNSRRYAKLLEKIARQHLKIARVRADFYHKVANYLLQSFDNIQVEDLNIKNMIKTSKHKGRRRGIYRAAWGGFVSILDYKAELYKCNIVKVNPKYTSQMCMCGAHAPKEDANRKHLCLQCGIVETRDVMSAKVINILGDASHPQNKYLSEARDRLESKLLGALI